jgi:hypothetical protein
VLGALIRFRIHSDGPAMDDDLKFSPDEIFQELGISPYVLIVWEKRGLLPSPPDARRRRYDLRAVQAIRDRNGLPHHPSMLEEPAPPVPPAAPRLELSEPEAQTELPPAAFNWRGRRVAKVRGLGPLKLSDKILAAQKSGTADELDALLDSALIRLIGVGRATMAAELQRHPEKIIAKFLGISVRRLQDICALYGVCRPAEAVSSTWEESGAGAPPATGLPFGGLLGPGVLVSSHVE